MATNGNVGQNQIPGTVFPTPLPGTIAASGNWNSGIFTSGGYPGLAVGVTLSQNGTLTLTRYLDPAGTIAVQSPAAVDLTGGTAGYVFVRDGVPFASFRITLANTGGSTGSTSGFYCLQSIQ